MNHSMVSYADNFEDVLLNRALNSVINGFYIDIGAYDPIEHSITKHFYDLGWRGINVEPNPRPFARLVEDRPRDINLNLGVSSQSGKLTIYEAPDACWSVDPSMLTEWFGATESQVRERSIPVVSLAELCETHVPKGTTIDFLKIDVEGHECEVVSGGDWTKWRPRVIVAESSKPEQWQPLLEAADYHFALFDGVNRIFMRDEDKELLPLLSVPVNVVDQFGIHHYLTKIEDLEIRLGNAKDLGHNSLAFARKVRDFSTIHPWMNSLAKAVLRRIAG